MQIFCFMRISRVFYVFRPTCIYRGIATTTPVPFSRGGQKMANPVREMNTVADGRKGDPQQDVEGKIIGERIFLQTDHW